MAAQGNNFWVASYPANMPGGNAMGGQGGGYEGADMLTARDPLDAKRMAAGFAPGASWPDGYLGNIIDRQEDKLLGALQHQNERSYVRGVHVGEKIGGQEYFWNQNMSPDMGIARQSAAVAENVEGGVVMYTQRFAPTGNPEERLAHDGKTAGMTDREQEARARQLGVDPSRNPVMVTDPARALRMRKDLPPWSGVQR